MWTTGSPKPLWRLAEQVPDLLSHSNANPTRPDRYVATDDVVVSFRLGNFVPPEPDPGDPRDLALAGPGRSGPPPADRMGSTP
jgi:hypothetical protein